MHFKLRNVLLPVCFFCLHASATLLPFSSTLPAVSTPYDSILLKTWQGIKKRNIDPYEIPMVHRPKSELPHDFVSEGAGYGMILALYCNDQVYFNKIWDAAETYLWAGQFYNWRANSEGGVIGTGAATDAEQDIALTLIFADLLVKKNVWQAHTSPKGVTYAQRAQEILNSIWSLMVEGGKYLRPGAEWGGSNFVNPGYFAPAFYRVFEEFDSENHNWSAVIDQCYASIALSPGYQNGLVPDWMKPTGEFCGEALGYNSYAGGEFFYKDAIRVLWRLATDYLWYNEPRAKTFLQKALAFIGTPERANFFQMDGSAVTDEFELGNGVTRQRTEHSHLTIGMWATAAMGAGGPQAAEPFSDELLKFYEGGDYWGKASDTTFEDTLHNEMYFDQFLAWFGASLISGVFTNLWEDMKDSLPGVPLQWVNQPTIGPFDIKANVEPLKISGVFNKTARWTVELVHWQDSTAWCQFSGKSSSIDISWVGISSEGSAMPQGYYDVTISARGLSEQVKQRVWLGEVLNLMYGNRLLIDDYRDGDLMPYIGSSWTSYLDSHEGKAGNSSVREFKIIQEDSPLLKWAYHLDQGHLGFDPYAALEWNCMTSEGNLNLSGLDTIIISARSASPLGVSVQLITSDITDYNYFHDSLYLNTQMKEFRLPVAGFTQRWSGYAQLDLSKVTAIRFQVQQPSGTENEIVLGKVYFTGNLGCIYEAPPAYIPPVIKTRKMLANRSQQGLTISTAGNMLKVKAYRTFNSMTIYDQSGRFVSRLNVRNGVALWDYSNIKGKRVPPGVYVLVAEGRENRMALPLNCRF